MPGNGNNTSDLVIANLESPLVRDGVHISGKCSLHGDPGWARVMKEAGIHHLGAGRDKAEACAPLFPNIKDKRIAFLARTSVIVTSPSYAEEKKPGVAFIDIEETKEKIKICKNSLTL